MTTYQLGQFLEACGNDSHARFFSFFFFGEICCGFCNIMVVMWLDVHVMITLCSLFVIHVHLQPPFRIILRLTNFPLNFWKLVFKVQQRSEVYQTTHSQVQVLITTWPNPFSFSFFVFLQFICQDSLIFLPGGQWRLVTSYD